MSAVDDAARRLLADLTETPDATAEVDAWEATLERSRKSVRTKRRTKAAKARPTAPKKSPEQAPADEKAPRPAAKETPTRAPRPCLVCWRRHREPGDYCGPRCTERAGVPTETRSSLTGTRYWPRGDTKK